jgi:hypothetical protein
MVAHRVDLGSVEDPLIAGNPLRLEVTARTNSGQTTGSYALVNLAGLQAIDYAVFRMVGDLPAATPSFVKSLSAGIAVVVASAGQFSILIGSHTALWTGRDWHSCRIVDSLGQPFGIFDGYVVSTVALEY